MPLALEGIRVVDLTTWQQGSGAPAILADLGAEVVKVERPGEGDPARGVTLSRRELRSPVRAVFEAANRGKRGVTLDIKHSGGRAVLERLIERADVLAMNFRPGVAERLELDYATLSERHERLIVAQTNGLGSRGPDAGVAVFDVVGQARSGSMVLLSDAKQPLRYVGAWGLSDQLAAIQFANAILAALVARSLHGVGQEVEVSQLGSAMAWQTVPLHTFLFTGQQPVGPSRGESRNPLFNIYRAGDDRWLCLACIPSDRYWAQVCRVLGLEALVADPRFAEDPSRVENAAELVGELDAAFAARPRDEWIERLKAGDIPAGPVQDYADLAADPQVAANGYIQEIDHPAAGRIQVVGVPTRFSRTPPRAPGPAPELGQHTEEVLLELGYSWDDIGELRREGVI